MIPNNNYWYHKEPPCLIKSFIKFKKVQNNCFQIPKPIQFSINYEALTHQPKVILNFGILKNIDHSNETFNSKLAMEWPGWRLIFTDASKLKTESNVGAAVWCPDYQISLTYKCPPIASVYTGETIAILEAVKFILAHKNKFERVIIFSDCLSCLQSVKSVQLKKIPKLPLVLNIRELLYECHLSGVEVVLAWIPGHRGIAGNEIVDSLAKGATISGHLDHNIVYSQDLCSKAKVDINEAWQMEWTSSSLVRGRYYKDIQPLIPSKPWFFKFRSTNKRTISVICRLRLGHICSPTHLFRIHVFNSPMCNCNTEEGTPEHILFNCPLFPLSLYDILPTKIPRPIHVKFLLLNIHNVNVFNALNRFIKLNNLKL